MVAVAATAAPTAKLRRVMESGFSASDILCSTDENRREARDYMNYVEGVNANNVSCIIIRATSSQAILMPQWTTFDEETALALRSKLPDEPVTEDSSTSALQYAVNRADTMVAVLPSSGFGQAGLAVIRWNHIPEISEPVEVSAPAEVLAVEEPVQYTANTRPGGFLGLSDEPLFEEEEKKSWWKKFWEG
jgi:hypothetical protein